MSNVSKSVGELSNKGSDVKASATKSVPTVKRHSEFFFDNTLVAIQVEDTLFNVHKYQLLKSETFSDMFKVPKQGEGEVEEGSSPEHPIIMEGVKASDFVALLKVLYASHFSLHQPEPEASLIIPAFRLANMWNFFDLRSFLLPLAEKHLNDIDKILFAREFDIKDWLAPAHIRLCQRQEKLTTEDARKLGATVIAQTASVSRTTPAITATTAKARMLIFNTTGPETSWWVARRFLLQATIIAQPVLASRTVGAAIPATTA
ncbi:hypothetical protein OPQ81_000383 [Rhizoctonia solani]|nr:hypothetical protein OPQ81_000383 [Rhizoctonia solani]